MVKNRVISCLIIISCCLIILISRLGQIQLITPENFSKNNINLLKTSAEQRMEHLIIDDGRGDILDKTGQSLINDNKIVLILLPFLNKEKDNLLRVAEIVNVEVEELLKAISGKSSPVIVGGREPIYLSIAEQRAINNLQIPGVFALQLKVRKQTQLAMQLLGVTGENPELLANRYENKLYNPKTPVGLTGLQASFDQFLISEKERTLSYYVDARGEPLFGLNSEGITINNTNFTTNVRTTIDPDLQLILEKAIDEHLITKGGALLLDIKTNDILALASRPLPNRHDPFSKDGLENNMFKNQIPGSVFKIVIAAGAIEQQLIDSEQLYDCSRKITGEYDDKYDHGLLSFTDSFARSCNYTFANIAQQLQKLDPNLLENIAFKLGLLNQVGWTGPIMNIKNFSQLFAEEPGRLFLNDEAKTDHNFVALTSIGQHEVRLSPLAIANMMATIARKGEKKFVRAATALEHPDGYIIAPFKSLPLQGEKISTETALELQRLLREVVTNEHGTGSFFKNTSYKVAGKSGTAQTGIFVKDGIELHNKWFAGYFPADNPSYALVTLNLHTSANEGAITPVFAQIVNEIYELAHRN